MSFYDLAKDAALSAHDLFKFRVKRDSTIPSRGGQKDFEPDGSWIQTKAVEAFIQERTSVLGEQRVEKLKSLVHGVWESNKKLVNVDKTGKFWAHMGFTDKHRHWLYPEEALFLMETNSLEVYEHGVPLSIQEAYGKFLSTDGVSLEEYQVFSHLRRLGYVVLRHEEQPILTDYERQLNLDKYISKKSLKERNSKLLKQKSQRQTAQEVLQDVSEEITQIGKTADNQTNVSDTLTGNDSKLMENSNQADNSGDGEDGRLASDSSSVSRSDSEADENAKKPPNSAAENNIEDRVLTNNKRTRPKDKEEKSSNISAKKVCLNREVALDNLADTRDSKKFYSNIWLDCFDSVCHSSQEGSKTMEECRPKTLQQTPWLEGTVPLPNMAGTERVSLVSPDGKWLPLNVEIDAEMYDQLNFDAECYRLKYPTKALSHQAQREEERNSRIQALDFSFAEWTRRKPSVTACNWAEYRSKLAQRMEEMATLTPVDYLWKGDVTPLVHLRDAFSYKSILDKLSIIQSVDTKDLQSNSAPTTDLKISYDVHLPDLRFKKSMPGVPNHRVCVISCMSDPPELSHIQQLWNRSKDKVPLHWSVVDSGEIAFYVFDNSQTLSQLI